MGSLAAAVEDEGHPEPDFPDRDPSPYDILREAVETAVPSLRSMSSAVAAYRMGYTADCLHELADCLERAMYLAAGGAE